MGSKAGGAPAKDVVTSRKALAPSSPTKKPGSQANDMTRTVDYEIEVEWHSHRPTTRSSNAPHTSPEQPESSRKALERQDVIEVHDDEDEAQAQPETLDDLFAEVTPSRPINDRKGKGRELPPPSNDGPAVRLKSTRRSSSPKKPTFAANPTPRGSRQKSLSEEFEQVEKARPDPIEDPDESDWGDEPKFVKESGNARRQPARGGWKGSQSRSNSPEKPPVARRTSVSPPAVIESVDLLRYADCQISTAQGIIGESRRSLAIRPSGIGAERQSIRLQGGYCIYQDSHRRDCFLTDTLSLDTDICLHREEAGTGADIRIPLDALRTLKVGELSLGQR